MEVIDVLHIFPPKMVYLCDVILGSEEKISDLAAQFSRNSGAANTFCLPFKRSTNIQEW